MIYQNNKTKVCTVVFLLLLPGVIYASFCLSGLYLEDVSILNIQEKITYVLSHPSMAYKNEKTGACVGVGIIIWMVAYAYFFTQAQLNLMHGQEYGTAKWGTVKEFNRKYADKNEHNNKIYSKNVRMSYSAETLRNNNIFMVGGSGAGKTAFEVSPNLLNLHGSNVYTDPKGGLLQDYGKFLEAQQDTRVYSINLCEPEKSMRFSPFPFIRKKADVTRLIRNIMQNTIPDENLVNTADPFWDKAESLYLQSIFLYIWKECPRVEIDSRGNEIRLERNFETVLYLLDEAKIDEDEESPLDLRMAALEARNPKHPAVVTYNRFKGGAGDTMRSIILCANSRFNSFDDPDLLRILSDNDIPLDEIGTGLNGDGKTKSNLFIVIPDDDDTYNFVPGMIYTLMFQEWYYQARLFGGKLPIDVGVWLDEFANIKMPANFEKILATCRSRGIYCVPIVQSLAQIKRLFKDGAWEGVVGNCDTFIYLGGNEQSSFKYVSELLGKWTIDKKTSGESKGTSGSTSQNYDVLGRELLTESEMRLLPDKKCIILVRGEKPIIDDKWYPWKHKIHHIAKRYGIYSYNPEERQEISDDDVIRQISNESVEYYEKLAKESNKVKVYDVSMTSFLQYDFSEDEQELTPEEIERIAMSVSVEKTDAMAENEEETLNKERMHEFILKYPALSLIEIFASEMIEEKRKGMIRKLVKAGIDEEKIKQVLHPKYSIEEAEVLTEAALAMIH